VRFPSLSTSKPAAARLGAQQRVVPIPPPAESGAVKFTTVAFSLAYDTFGQANAPATIPAIVRVLHGSGAVDTIDVTVEVGRKWFTFLQTDEEAVSVQLPPQSNWPSGFRPQVSAMVEYATP
jgi:hypothetical protein